jgi:hypothetical protein
MRDIPFYKKNQEEQIKRKKQKKSATAAENFNKKIKKAQPRQKILTKK